jgi:hypothetical protein
VYASTSAGVEKYINTNGQLERISNKSVYNKLSSKATEQEAFKTFKEVSSFMRMEYSYLNYVPAFPHLPQTLIGSALNSKLYK